MNKNKLITEIDFKYKNLFRRIIRSVLATHSYIPIEWEDIYYEFLFEVPELSKDFDPSKGLKEHSYYSVKLKFFTLNKCRHFSGNKFRYLNEASMVDSDFIDILSDSDTSISLIFDAHSLSPLELLVYEEHVLNHKTLKNIAIEKGTTYWEVRKAFQKLKTKMLNQIRY